MSFKRKSHNIEVDYEVTGEEPMIAVHGGPNGEKFIPAFVRVKYEDGQLDSVYVHGPQLNAKGKPLKRWIFTGYDEQGLTDTTDPEMVWDNTPQWLKDLVEQTR